MSLAAFAAGGAPNTLDTHFDELASNSRLIFRMNIRGHDEMCLVECANLATKLAC